MRSVFFLFVTALSTGCMHHIGLSAEDQCASQGMALDDLSIGSGTASTFGRNGMTTIARMDAIHCAKAKTEAEQCRIDAIRGAVPPVIEYDSGVVGKNLGLACGYALWVIPGVVLYYHWDDDRDDAVKAYREAFTSGMQRCTAPTAPAH